MKTMNNNNLYNEVENQKMNIRKEVREFMRRKGYSYYTGEYNLDIRVNEYESDYYTFTVILNIDGELYQEEIDYTFNDYEDGKNVGEVFVDIVRYEMTHK